MTTWMVRAERGGALFEDFTSAGHVTVGWPGTGDAAQAADRDDLRARVAIGQPELSEREASHGGSTVWRFAREIAPGDDIVTYDPSSRVYAFGTIDGAYRHDPSRPEVLQGNQHPHIRRVRWSAEIPRDSLSQRARNTLGSISSLFSIRKEVAEELRSLARGEEPRPAQVRERSAVSSAAEVDAVDQIDPEISAADLEERAMTGIADLVTAISPDDMEQFVAGLLRALGYHARVSPKGPDRGRDILATPNPLGLEDPRIHVEVKHRRGKADPGMIRSFLGGRGPGDRGIFVSTGGFSREARYEADRASIPVQLLDADDLVRLLVENDEKLAPEIARMVPLRRIWWPH